jgi:nucleotide-binding universal stress UspA family protein
MYRTILVPVDGSEFSAQAVPVAAAIARHSGAALHLLRVWDAAQYAYGFEIGLLPVETDGALRIDASEWMAPLAVRASVELGHNVHTAMIDGSASATIQAHSEAIGADLIVMSTHGRTGLNRAWIGSVADTVLRHSTAPLLLWRPTHEPPAATPVPPFRHILVPLDGSAAAEEVLPHAVSLGGPSCEYELVTVVRPARVPEHPYAYAASSWRTDEEATCEIVRHAQNYLQRVRERVRGACTDLRVETKVIADPSPAAGIVAAAADAGSDLIAFTSHARRAVRVVLGSVADKVLRASHGPVLLLHPRAE